MYKKMCLVIVLTAFSMVAQAGNWNVQSIGGFSQVNVFSPENDSPIGNGKALLVILHGCTQPAYSYETAQLEEAADQLGYVIAAPEAAYKQGFGCWGYWTGVPTRVGFGNDYVNIFNMITELQTLYSIDPAQIYISGFNSGGAMAMETGCLAPDVFAGIAVDAGASAGTSANGSMGPKEGTIESTRQACLSYAGTNAGWFDTQLFNGAAGTDSTGAFVGTDGLVNRGYVPQNAGAMAMIYGVSEEGAPSPVMEGGKTAIETRWENKRVTTLALVGVGHAWSGGNGASGSFITNSGINYGRYLMEYFTANNQRAVPPTQPDIQLTDFTVDDHTVFVAGTITDPNGVIMNADYSLSETADPATTEVGQIVPGQNGEFTLHFSFLGDAEYQLVINAADNDGQTAHENRVFTIDFSSVRGDLDGDHDVDRDDLTLLKQDINQPAATIFDRRDLNGDGMVSVTDMRSLVMNCTHARCEVLTSSCPSMTGPVNPDLLDAGLVEEVEASWFIRYQTTGDQQAVYAWSGQFYTLYIGPDGKGYMTDPMNCLPQ